MDIVNKILEVLFLFVLVYFWNRFAIRHIIKSLSDFHKKNNQHNLDKQPIKFFVGNEGYIYIFACGFYWFGALIISYGILFD